MDKIKAVEKFFYPESIAVVGASNNPSKAGCQIVNNLTELGYQGEVFPVNPKEDLIKGLKCYRSITEIEAKIDLLMITVPARGVLPVVDQAVERGDIKAIVVVSAGFSETKTAEGVEMEKTLVETAKRSGIRLFGPNCTGVINTALGLDTTIEPTVEQVSGGVSVFSQSGAMAGSILLFAENQPWPLGFSKWAHVGNMCDVDTVDMLEYYGQDPETEVIVIYMEGYDKGLELMEAAQRITSSKPILVLKVGRNELGAKAAYSHTGSLAGRFEVYDAAFRKSGITRVDNLYSLVNTAKCLTMQPLPQGNRVCILTEAGGPGTMAMDQLGLTPTSRLAHISRSGRKKLQEVLPEIAIICEPDGYIDMTAAAMAEHHADALEVVLEEPGVDAVILITVPPTFLPPEDVAEAVIKRAKGSSKPILTCFLAGKWVYEARRMLEKEGFPTFDIPEQAVEALNCMVDRQTYLNKLYSFRNQS